MSCDSFLLYHVTNASNIVYFLLVSHEYHRLKLPGHGLSAILFQLRLRHLISPFNSPFPPRNSTFLILYIKMNFCLYLIQIHISEPI